MYDEIYNECERKRWNVCDSCYVTFVVFGDQQSYCIGFKDRVELNLQDYFSHPILKW